MSVRVAGSTANLITDADLEQLAKNKCEARFVYDGVSQSGGLIRPYMATQFGYANFSANSSPITTRSFPMPEPAGNILGARASVMNHNLKATVTDVTSTSITIACSPWLITADTATGSPSVFNFSGVTTQAVRVFWEVTSTPLP